VAENREKHLHRVNQFEWSSAAAPTGDAIDAGQMHRSGLRSCMVRDYDHIPDDEKRARFLAHQTKRNAELRDADLGLADLTCTISSECKAAEQNKQH
jgi:hypothetical protein